MFPLALHVSGLHWPIIRDVLSCCYATIWFLSCLLAYKMHGTENLKLQFYIFSFILVIDTVV
jgi:hypothetical protein